MKLSKLLQEDWRVQEHILELSRTLAPGECIFALRVPFGFQFKIIDESRKRFFRITRKPFDPVYITSMRLEHVDNVHTIGVVIEVMKRDKQTINN